jgi:hypothetical protein
MQYIHYFRVEVEGKYVGFMGRLVDKSEAQDAQILFTFHYITMLCPQ